jgi:uncharacterized protein YfdQ (DUF2303 family)
MLDALLKRLSGSRALVRDGNALFAVVPNDHAIKPVDDLLDAPRWPRAAVAAQTAAGFSAYLARFREAETVVFTDRVGHGLQAVIDYHGEGSGDADVRGGARHCAHVLRYTAPKSPQFKVWTGVNNTLMPQAAFAEFLEENAIDIVDPPSADILEIAGSLLAKKKVDFSSSIRLADGSNELTWNETVETATAKRGKMAVPDHFHIGIPIFVGEQPYKFKVWLRHRIEEGRLGFAIKLHRLDPCIDDSFGQIVDRIEVAAPDGVPFVDATRG